MIIINRKIKSKFSFLVICIFIILISFLLVACTNKIKEFKGEYAVIYTNVFKQQGGIMDIDLNGNILGKESVNMQDIFIVDNSDDYIIMSGHRKNNNIIYKSNGDKKEVYFLNNPKYTGVTAVELYNDSLVSIMNGNVSDGIYKTLLVIQDMEDNVIHDEIIEMYPRDLLIEGQTLYIGGNSKRATDSQWDSKIMKFDLVKNEFIKEQVQDSLYNFKKLQLLNNNIYAITEDKNYIPRIISIIDKDNLTITKQEDFNEEIIDIFNYDEYLYILFNNRICKYDKEFNIIESEKLDTNMSFYINYNLFINKELYVYIRSEKKEVLDNGKTIMGKIAKISLDDLSSIKYTDYQVENSENVENVVLFPTSFFDK